MEFGSMIALQIRQVAQTTYSGTVRMLIHWYENDYDYCVDYLDKFKCSVRFGIRLFTVQQRIQRFATSSDIIDLYLCHQSTEIGFSLV